jgi:hypothetical protein
VPRADGTVETVTLTNNGKSAYENLKTANKEFFDKTPQEQAEIIALTLHQHTMLGVQKAKDLSIITTTPARMLRENMRADLSGSVLLHPTIRMRDFASHIGNTWMMKIFWNAWLSSRPIGRRLNMGAEKFTTMTRLR